MEPLENIYTIKHNIYNNINYSVSIPPAHLFDDSIRGWYTHLWLNTPLRSIVEACPLEYRFTHWGRDKMEAISQTTSSSAFSWMKMFEFRSNFQGSVL